MLLPHPPRIMLLLQLTAICLHILHAAPQQQQNADIDRIVNQLFSMDPKTAQQTPQGGRTGFDVVVTPEPFDPSQPQINFNSVSGKAACNCVPYHMCVPNNPNGSGSNTGNNNNNNSNNPTDDSDIDGFGKIDLRFDQDDPVCAHFLDVCCDSGRTREESITPVPQEQRPNRAKGCGIRNVGGIDFSIAGANDNEAGFGEFPWTVALLHAANYSYFCAGSLIHPRVVLTANHCLLERTAGSFLVRAGEWDTQTTKERLPYVERTVQRIIPHPQYNARSVAYDFALIILSEGFTLDDHINTVCLPAQNFEPAARTTCFSTGWGKDVFGAAGRFSTIMKRVPLPIVDFAECVNRLRRTRLGPRYVLDRTFLCAGGQRGNDTCQGDGGGPLVCPIGSASENRYQQSGIVAWGIGCNDEIPAAYANVALARDWIDEQMLGNGLSTSSYSAP